MKDPVLFPFAAPATLAGVLVALLLSSCSGDGGADPSASGPPAAMDVVVARAEIRPFSDSTIAVGNLRSYESVDISATVTDRIESIHFDDGEFVEEGQLLAQLADEEERAMLRIAEAEFSEEQRELERLKGLTETGAVAAITLAERETRTVIASGGIEQAAAQVEDRRIVAPFSGLVGLRRLSAGALVTPGVIITTLDQIEKMKLDFTVPEVFLGDLRPGTTLQARSAAFPEKDFAAEIETVDSRVEPVTRSITVRAIIENEDLLLRPGMLMTVELQRNARESLAIPERAIVPEGRRQAVFVIDGESVARLTSVEIGARVPGYVEVLSGLSEGERVVTDGVILIGDGSAVEVVGEFEGPAEPFDPSARVRE